MSFRGEKFPGNQDEDELFDLNEMFEKQSRELATRMIEAGLNPFEYTLTTSVEKLDSFSYRVRIIPERNKIF